ncbi:hypothetical protein FM037_27470 [Shewanella psychropiezotolerans]|uniref:Uncharacterized protein n=1 Tax=Shewanella psychropiezotolerans TaxID=2593655 RepID=A0ABX5X4P5_9GAMM|nr:MULTISPECIES: hypothetical protein [Shewanella]MPY25712.1 hypothetical protein [Shewanella sp. YLB-07]QDO86321.1 hypothetical protein FM037_27470 [Shewanella psychropiezotolerans]
MKYYGKIIKINSAFILSLGIVSASHAEVVNITYDTTLDGINDSVYTSAVNLFQNDDILTGNDSNSGVLSGHIEEKNNSFIGSGSNARFNFKLKDSDGTKWFVGSENSNGLWKGTWYGANGESGDFSFSAEAKTPVYSDIDSFSADSIFTGGAFDYYRPLNDAFLVDSEDYHQGMYLQSDSGGLPFPMSFSMILKKDFSLKSFKLGSYNNGQGTRLKTFTFDVWENNTWVTKGSFNFAPISGSPQFQRQEFTLQNAVLTSKFRISATETSDYYNGGRILMWGLSFN